MSGDHFDARFLNSVSRTDTLLGEINVESFVNRKEWKEVKDRTKSLAMAFNKFAF